MEKFDIIVIGAGSGNMLVGDGFEGLKVALIDEGRPFGGTCLNRGCIPTKMLAHTGAVAEEIRHASRFGLGKPVVKPDWSAIHDRVFDRIDPIANGSEASRSISETVALKRGHARFTDPHTVEVTLFDGTVEQLHGERFVIATGSRPSIPEIPGLDHPDIAPLIHTSDSIMRVEQLPSSLIVLGGGVVACEFADIFANLGVKVTVIQRSGTLLRRKDADIARAFTHELAHRDQGQINVRLNQQAMEVEPGPNGLTLYTCDADGIEYSYNANAILVATGRVPNSDKIGREEAGLEVDESGYLVVDETLRTSVPHIYALGDVDNPHELKHVANHEARVVRHNLLHPEAPITVGDRPVPWAMFTTPQIASVGATEAELAESGVPYVSAIHFHRDVAYGWALEDDGDHFVKVLAHSETGLILGAHIYGPDAALLLQPLIQAMTFGLDAATMARGQYWPHPGLQEVVENALLKLPEPQEKKASSKSASADTGAVKAKTPRWGKKPRS
ncbi:MAG: mycothione reductase [Propionibacteriaceae bacterium]|jgi:mycothione reductase|nr:mycothione reductase [Propionibacteriaceae bacterium]